MADAPKTDAAWTIGRLLNWTTDYLKQHGSDSPRLDAEVLLAHARKCPRIALYTTFEEEPKDDERATFREMVKQRAAGCPVAYLVGKREFYSLDFVVSRDVLIPRPETEHSVVAVLDFLKTYANKSAKIADVCTGSGAIAIAVAKHAKQATVTAIDVSPPAVEIARQNAAAHNLADRVTCVEGDLLTGLSVGDAFDVIVSNPPYVTTGEMAQLPNTVKDFEPRLALDGGADGLTFYRRLIEQAPPHLVPGGLFVLEVGPTVAAAVAALVDGTGRFEVAKVQKDLAQQPRVCSAIFKG